MQSQLLYHIILIHYMAILGPFDFASEDISVKQKKKCRENDAVNERPMIGILTRPDKLVLYGDEFVDASYVRYLQMAGARVVPVRPKGSRQYYEKLFNSINGIFLPGGAASMKNGTYRETAELMFNLAIKANDRGDYFPIWGTCSGFEVMIKIVSDDLFSLDVTESQNTSLPVKFAFGFENSRLFQDMPEELIKHLSEKNSTSYNHKWSALNLSFTSFSKLTKFFKVLTTTQHNGFEFVSTFEAHNYPFYGVQWHPERTIFNWSHNLTVDHSYHSIKVSHYLADFFVGEARKSFHLFDSIEDEAQAVIENAKRIFVPSFNVGERFYFNYTDDI